MKRKTKSIILIVALSLAMLLLATGVAAAMTNGFKNVNPYGWLENFDRIKKDSDINGFEVCKDFEMDFAKLIKGVKATEDKEAGTKTYALVKTDNESVYVNVVETIVDEKSSYALIVNGQSVCTSADGFNDTAIEAIKSFDTCKVSEVHNAGRLAHYIGATFVKAEEGAESKKKYELMSVGQTISGFEYDFSNFDMDDLNELIAGLTFEQGEGGEFVYLLNTDAEYSHIYIRVDRVEINGKHCAVLMMGVSNIGDSYCVYSNFPDIAEVDIATSGTFEFDSCQITKIANAEILAKYLGAKA